jgi:type I restriction-modification system DNA methylase subunit
MAKKSTITEQDVTNKFTDVIADWDRLEIIPELNRRWKEQETLQGSNHTRPDVTADFIKKDGEEPVKLVVEVKKASNKAKEAKEQLFEYMDKFNNLGYHCLGVTCLYNSTKGELVVNIYNKNIGEAVVEIKNDEGLEIFEYLDNAYERIKYSLNKPVVEIVREAEDFVLKKAKELHEYIYKNPAIDISSRVIILNACVFACSSVDFRNNLAKVKDDGGFSGSVRSAINGFLTLESMRIRDSILLACQILENSGTAMNERTVDAQGKINPKYYNAKDPKVSILKFICCFILDNIIEPLESKFKGKKIDISTILYREFMRYATGDGHEAGVVLTPTRATRIMANLVITSPKDRVIDLCMGSGAFMIAAKNRKEELVKTEEEKEYVNTGYFGSEISNQMFFLSYANFHFNNMDVNNTYNKSCFDISKEIEDFQPTCGLLNPPYSQDKDATASNLNELSFCKYAMSFIQKGGKFACVIPSSCGSSTQSVVQSLKEEILSKHTLDTVIKLNPVLFHPHKVGTMIFVFRCNIPHDFDKTVFFADYEHDGFKVINDKLVPIKNVDVDEIERNITSVCVEYKETDDSYFKKIKLNSEWAYVLDNDILTNKYLIYNNFSNYEKVYNQRS